MVGVVAAGTQQKQGKQCIWTWAVCKVLGLLGTILTFSWDVLRRSKLLLSFPSEDPGSQQDRELLAWGHQEEWDNWTSAQTCLTPTRCSLVSTYTEARTNTDTITYTEACMQTCTHTQKHVLTDIYTHTVPLTRKNMYRCRDLYT